MAKKKPSEDEDPDDAAQEAEDGENEESSGPKYEPSNTTRYVGLALIMSVIVGFGPLRDAFQGNGSFESAMIRFLACVVACLIGASILGRMVDSVDRDHSVADDDHEDDADGARSNDAEAPIEGGETSTADLGRGDSPLRSSPSPLDSPG